MGLFFLLFFLFFFNDKLLKKRPPLTKRGGKTPFKYEPKLHPNADPPILELPKWLLGLYLWVKLICLKINHIRWISLKTFNNAINKLLQDIIINL